LAFYFFPPGLVHTKRLPSHATGALEGTGRTRRSVDATSCRAGGVGVLTLPRQNLTRAPPKKGGGSLGLLFFSAGPSPHEASPKPRYWRVGGHMTYAGIGWCNILSRGGGGRSTTVTLPRQNLTRAPPKNGGGSLGLLFFSTGPSPHEASPKPRYWRVGGHMTYTGIGWCNVYRFWLQGGGGVGVVTLPRKTIRPGTPLLESGI